MREPGPGRNGGGFADAASGMGNGAARDTAQGAA